MVLADVKYCYFKHNNINQTVGIFFSLKFQEVNNWHFDIFRLHDKSSGHSLKYVAKELFSRYGIVSRFRLNLDKLESFLTAVEFGYTKLKNPYHNDIHAADVTQTLHYFIGSTGLAVSTIKLNAIFRSTRPCLLIGLSINCMPDFLHRIRWE